MASDGEASPPGVGREDRASMGAIIPLAGDRFRPVVAVSDAAGARGSTVQTQLALVTPWQEQQYGRVTANSSWYGR
jgi:hypothetical protein